jgi:signal transduction histidine kinase
MRLNSTSTPTMHDRTPIAAPHSHRAHTVQFYEDDAFYFDTVAEFLGNGLAVGQPGLVVAAPERRERLVEALERRGGDPRGRLERGELVILDAHRMLESFMVGDAPSAERFEQVMEGVFARVTATQPEVEVCAHGEMVDILWQAGKADAAVRLEELWNHFAERHALSLLCTYGIRNFSSAADADRFAEICRQHDHVLPTERFIGLDDTARLSEISALQQRAQVLEAEIVSRREAEVRLREVLAAQSELLLREQAARLEAEEASRAKRDFLAVMSHELRTPLNAIAGYAELLELGVHGPVTERQRECLERIQRSQQRLLGLIDEVLILSRTETGKVRYVMEEVPVQEVLRAAELGVMPQIHAREIRFVGSEGGERLVAVADRERMQQILMHLLSNAVKFTEHGGEVRVECRRDGTEALVRVWNSGAGIPADKLEAVFQPFFQVDARLTREHQGAGLGLSISRQFARGMGGDVTVESAAGAGAVFTLRLRAA